MDPSTTLFTFMLQTALSTQSVSLVGSWDNFSKRYPMEKDARRGHGQWRGCYSFKNIICDGDGSRSPKRNGGLKMGHTYWYYYELDDGTEIHDTNLPSTNFCPYLPGQPVNLLWVPIEINPVRERSASTGSLTGGYKTMNPDDKYLTPRAPPAIPRLARLDTSPALLDRKRATRSVSPKEGRSPWSARAFFGLRTTVSALPEERPRPQAPWDMPVPQAPQPRDTAVPLSQRASEKPLSEPPSQFPLTKVITTTTRTSRSTSPTSMRKLSRSASPITQRHPIIPSHSFASIPSSNPLTIPFDITEEDLSDDDDSNFATSSLNPELRETALSPPPTASRTTAVPLSQLRDAISDMKPLPMLPTPSNLDDTTSSSSFAQTTALPTHSALHSPSMIPPPLRLPPPPPPHAHIPASDASLSPSSSLPSLEPKHLPRSHFSVDTLSSGFISPTESHYSLASASSTWDSHYSDDYEEPPAIIDDANGICSSDSRAGEARGFLGYSLPSGDFSSEATIRKDEFEQPHRFEQCAPEEGRGVVGERGGGNALDQFLNEMGYLGGVIAGK